MSGEDDEIDKLGGRWECERTTITCEVFADDLKLFKKKYEYHAYTNVESNVHRFPTTASNFRLDGHYFTITYANRT